MDSISPCVCVYFEVSDRGEGESHIESPGVVYLGHLPPFLRPSKVQKLLSTHAKINRLYLVPEPEEDWIARRKSGGNRKRSYLEGWVEFTRKEDAKMIAATLNNTPMEERGHWANDLWCLKYLRGVRWEHVSQSLTVNQAARDQRIRNELQSTMKENEEYLRTVKKAKALQAIADRKNRKNSNAVPRIQRSFRQREAVDSATLIDIAESSMSLGDSSEYREAEPDVILSELKQDGIILPRGSIPKKKRNRVQRKRAGELQLDVLETLFSGGKTPNSPETVNDSTRVPKKKKKS